MCIPFEPDLSEDEIRELFDIANQLHQSQRLTKYCYELLKRVVYWRLLEEHQHFHGFWQEVKFFCTEWKLDFDPVEEHVIIIPDLQVAREPFQFASVEFSWQESLDIHEKQSYVYRLKRLLLLYFREFNH